MSWGAAMVASLLVVLPRPTLWVVALSPFLVRGGLVLFLVPIVVVPSPVNLATAFGPTITRIALSGLSPEFALIIAVAFATFLAWLLVGGWAAAIAERDLIAAVAVDEDLPRPDGAARPWPVQRPGRTWRIVVVRLAGHLPTVVALAWGALRLVQATYRELTVPSDVATPIALRVMAAVPDVVLGIVATWSLGEILGSLGARRIVLRGQSVDAAYLGAWADLLRRPVSAIATFVVPTAVLLLAIVPLGIGAGIAWDGLRVRLATGNTGFPIDVALVLIAFVAVWLAGLLVAGLLAAWRSAAGTLETLRGWGTFGGSVNRRPGDWLEREPSGRL